MLNGKLPTKYQEFIHLSRYSRWLPKEGRRETWRETVTRYFDFFQEHLKESCNYKLDSKLREELEDAVIHLDVMQSMRCLMTADAALRSAHLDVYHCSYVAVDLSLIQLCR